MRLQTRIILMMLIILLASGSVGGGIMITLQKRASEVNFARSASALANAVLSSLESDMLAARREHIQQSVAQIGRGSGINEVVIFDYQGRIAASTEEGEIGAPSGDVDVMQVLATGEARSRRETTQGREELCILLPVVNKDACTECHDPGREVLGVIEVGLDVTPLNAFVRGQSLLVGGFVLIGMLVVAAALSLVLRGPLTWRLSRLKEAAARVAQGNYSVLMTEEGKDEIGSLARSFNEMAMSLERRSQELAEARENLEERVRERTLELEEKEKMRTELLQRLTSAQEEERARIARDLHDEIGQGLTTVAVSCASAAQQLPPRRNKEKQLFLETREVALQTLHDVRRIMSQLRPEALDELGLPAALRWMIQERLKDTDIEVEMDIPDASFRPARQVELTLYRTAQESLNNVIRHSGATRVTVSLSLNDGAASLQVADNGKGFDPRAVLEGQRLREGWGLIGMQERLRLLGGTLQIESSPGQGTRLRAICWSANGKEERGDESHTRANRR